MNSEKTHSNSGRARTRANPFLRGFMDGVAGLFNIFGAARPWSGTPEDDAQELRADVEQIAEDFYAVFASIESTARK